MRARKGSRIGPMTGSALVSAQLSTDRVDLAPVTEEDIPELHRLLADPDVRRYLCDGKDLGAAWVGGLVETSQADFAARGLGLWAARLRGRTRVIGLVGYREFFEPPVLELLYALAPSEWGTGVASEMAAAAIEFGFGLGLPVIRASTDEPNQASVRVLEGLGFEESTREPADPPHTQWEQIHFVLRPPA